jgi:hypothetical protein
MLVRNFIDIFTAESRLLLQNEQKWIQVFFYWFKLTRKNQQLSSAAMWQ